MSTISHARRPGRSSEPDAQPLWCLECGTDRHLIIDCIDQLSPARADVVKASYTCNGCGFFYTHPTTVSKVAAVLNRPGPAPVLGVLQFGDTYIHCGEPMHNSDSKERSIHGSVSTEQRGEPILDIYLRTRVLHCGCGFQMEIPH
ncbi:hypothetical protein [Arthrobacter sp. ISL-30]|uniref:hypothetical protein n=1 Tax=Arthrobacter sp. ISL-30 TaxID=2819109 RepID=UPI001BE9E1AF|nr:hypothetical protein [Arthrobacter sp. ISL-30]MBT2515524.1 hypothetical protein [Arthrobacter sp. ISL-30]